MIEVFRSRDSATIGHLQSLIEAEGIKTYLRNEHVANTAIAIPEFTPAICIANDDEVDRAVNLIRSYLESSGSSPSEEQTCPKCGETSPGSFAACWKCDAPLGA